jgi:hypothetical protein
MIAMIFGASDMPTHCTRSETFTLCTGDAHLPQRQIYDLGNAHLNKKLWAKRIEGIQCFEEAMVQMARSRLF